jgi:hypothetical protein
MASDSFGKTVYLTNEMADKIIAAQERMRANPPKPRERKIKWGDPEKVARALRKEYGYEE